MSWCCCTPDLDNVKVAQNNKRYMNFGPYVLGKSNLENDSYDILVFAARDICIAEIPSFIKQIGTYVFNSCRNLRKVVFKEDAQLEFIDSYAFDSTKIEEIEIPKHVKMIGNMDFACSKLNHIYFAENSELRIIHKVAFFKLLLNSIEIPSQVCDIGIEAFEYCENLKIIEIKEDNEFQSLRNLHVNCDDKFIMIPKQNKK